jgi:hypothetical protein
MSNLTISQLTGANTPLVGDELTVIVQDGETRQCEVQQFFSDVDSGTYSPVLVGVTNIVDFGDSFDAQYMKIGNVVTVSGAVRPNATGISTLATFTMTLPFVGNFESVGDLGGTTVSSNRTVGNISANIANNTALFSIFTSVTSSPDLSFTLTYKL